MLPNSLHVLFTGLVIKGMVSGGDQLFIDLATRLPKKLSITLITPEIGRQLWKDIKEPNIRIIYLKSNIFDQKTNPLFVFLSYLVRAFQVYRILRKEKVESIYSCSDIAYADIWPAFFITGNRKIRWYSRIYHVLLPPKRRQGSFLVNVWAYNLQKISFWMMKKRSTKILALNKKLYDEVLNLGLPKEKLGILGAGIDFYSIQKFKPVKRYDYDVVVLGRIAPVKGIYDTVKMWVKVHERNPDWKIAWIGGGPENFQEKMRALIKENNLDESFKLLGFIQKDEIFSIMKSAKVFLCPDHENGWGLAVSEAMSAGLPVVSYDIDIFGSVYSQGFRSVPLFDTDKLADQMIEILEDDKLRLKLATEAVEQARRFDHQKVVDNLISYLQNS